MVDKTKRTCYNVIVMNELTQKIPTQIAQEADNLSKETGIPFRDCLEVIYKAYLLKSQAVDEKTPIYAVAG